ncbi:BPSS1780 family membrane protein [Bordetella genomosp. 8]|uniref:BPSS1780 family membrane protein n=1 Tax=Bordetella genomosp. 8 TaxID=1416806 RepID=UPI001E5C6CA1|nr:BPSS1780 family membrane protein [Bordetella genomosp. 8]
MQAASLPATAGWQWAREGFRLFMRQPLALFTWSLVVSLLLLFAMFTVPIGPLFCTALMPCVTLMTLSACKHIDADRTMLPSMWLKPLQKPGVLKKLLILGGLYAGLCMLAGLIAFVPFSNELADGIRAASVTNDYVPFFETLHTALLIFGTLYLIIGALFWHAPVLVAWHNVRLSQALFFSGVACWRNKWAFLVYGLTWAAVFLGIDFCASTLISLDVSQTLVNTVQVPVSIAAFGVLYSSFYPAYTSVFEVDGAGFQLDDGHGTQA